MNFETILKKYVDVRNDLIYNHDGDIGFRIHEAVSRYQELVLAATSLTFGELAEFAWKNKGYHDVLIKVYHDIERSPELKLQQQIYQKIRRYEEVSE